MLTNNVSKAVFKGNGTTTNFPFTFKVWEESQILVQIVDPEDITTTATDYTISLTSSGGTVTYRLNNAPLPTGYHLVILRNMPFKQEVDLITGTRFDPEVIETQLDQATAERQQLLELASRAIQVPPSSEDPPELLAEEIFDARDSALASAQNAAENALSANTANSQAQAHAETAASAISIVESLKESVINEANGAMAAIDQNELEALGEITGLRESSEVKINALVTESINTIEVVRDSVTRDVEQAGVRAADTAITAVETAGKESIAQAQAWAESDTNPDLNDPASHSAKWWAQQAGQGVPDATTVTSGKVRLATSNETTTGTGDGVVVSGDLANVYTAIDAKVTSAQNTADDASDSAATNLATLNDAKARGQMGNGNLATTSTFDTTEVGAWAFHTDSTTAGTSPISAGGGVLLVYKRGGGIINQLAFTDSVMYFRRKTSAGEWTNWGGLANQADLAYLSPIETTNTGVGQIVSTAITNSATYNLPSGGTWVYTVIFQNTSSGNVGAITTSVKAGGSAITTSSTQRAIITAKRIA